MPTFDALKKTSKRIANAFNHSGMLSRTMPKLPDVERGISHKGAAGLPPQIGEMAIGAAVAPRSDDDEAIDALFGTLYDTIFEQRAALYQSRLTETFADPDQWLTALPAPMQTSAGLESMLLPVRNPALATNDRAVEGLDDLLISLVLDPRFQLK